MTQPKFAPIAIDDEARPTLKLEVPRAWTPHRPAELDAGACEPGTGPDQGYLALLAERFVDAIILGDREHMDDVLAAATALGMARAAAFGRAPIAKDLEFALTIFGYLAPQSLERIAVRSGRIGGLAHDQWRRRQFVASVPSTVLRSSPDDAAAFVWHERASA